jgi:hypothetical protein
LKLLVENKSDINAKTNFGQTPIHQASETGEMLVLKSVTRYDHKHLQPAAFVLPLGARVRVTIFTLFVRHSHSISKHAHHHKPTNGHVVLA